MKKLIIAAAWSLVAALLLCGCDFLLEDISVIQKSSSAQQQKQERDEKKKTITGRGYACLTDPDEQDAYAALDIAANQLDPQDFEIKNGNGFKNFSDIIEFYKNDNPQAFWLKDDVSYSYIDNGDTVTIQLGFKLKGDKLKQAKEKLDSKVRAITDAAPQNGSDYEKELYVNDYLVDHCVYDEAAVKLHEDSKIRGHEQDAYGALVEGKAVCEGYTRAFHLLCNKLGVSCEVIEGNADEEDEETGKKQSMPHIWNCVRLDGNWYHVDVTWNDDNHGDFADVYTRRYYFLNLTDEDIKRDHVISPLYGEPKSDDVFYNDYVPKCNSTYYNYFKLNCQTLTSLDDASNVIEAMTQAAAGQESYFDFLVDGSLDFANTKSQLAEGVGYQWIEEANSSNEAQISTDCSLCAFEDRRLITFLLNYE